MRKNKILFLGFFLSSLAPLSGEQCVIKFDDFLKGGSDGFGAMSEIIERVKANNGAETVVEFSGGTYDFKKDPTWNNFANSFCCLAVSAVHFKSLFRGRCRDRSVLRCRRLYRQRGGGILHRYAIRYVIGGRRGMIKLFICPKCGWIRTVSRRVDVECLKCEGKVQMLPAKLDYAQYTKMSPQERQDYVESWLYIHRDR